MRRMRKLNPEHLLTVEGIEVAYYMSNHGCNMVEIEEIPEELKDSKVVFYGENVHEVYAEALTKDHPKLNPVQYSNMKCMLCLLIVFKMRKLRVVEVDDND